MSTTPGPWHAMAPFGKTWSDHGYRTVAEVRGIHVYAEARNMLQKGRGFVWGDKEDDAQLLAAAPAMRDALEDALEFIEQYEDVRDGSYGEQEPNRAMHLAQSLRAVLAKAGA